MVAKIQAIVERMSSNLTGVMGILTTLIMLSAAGFLTFDLMAADAPANVAPVASAGVNRTVLTVALIFGLAIIAPLVGALSFFILLKRFGGKMGPLIHIEYGAPATPAVVVGPYTGQQVAAASNSLDALAAAFERKRQLESLEATMPAVVRAELPMPQTCDLGPTVEEELQGKRSQASRQDEAVLAQLFANNLRLHEELNLTK